MIPLTLFPNDDEHGRRAARDRLELLTTLIAAPSFDPLYRDDTSTSLVSTRFSATNARCLTAKAASAYRTFCVEHKQQWRTAEAGGHSRAEFIRTSAAHLPYQGMDCGTCRICPQRPAKNRQTRLCWHHYDQWKKQGADVENLENWVTTQESLPGFGICQVYVCPYNATSPIGLCTVHDHRYRREDRPGRATLPWQWHRSLRAGTKQITVSYTDERLFRQWCATEEPARRTGVINLVGLQPMVKAEIKWGMFAHTLRPDPTSWDSSSIQRLASTCRRQNLTSMFDIAADGHRDPTLRNHTHNPVKMISREIIDSLRLVYYSPLDTRDAGFIETDHFGRRFVDAVSYYDLTGVSQRWLRDLLWDHLADVLRSPRCPRRRGVFDNLRRATLELSAFLNVEAPKGGHDPRLLGEDHAHRFVADQRQRARHSLTSLVLVAKDGTPAVVTDATSRVLFNHIRKLCHWALLSGLAEQIGLDSAFINTLPTGGTDPKRSRNPFSDEVARALADNTNLEQLAALDRRDRGARDIWETIVYTGRRCGEVRTLRLDCIGRYSGLAMLWHDQTKVGNYNEAIRIPEVLYQLLDRRRTTTLRAFENRRGRAPTPTERANMALFPSSNRNPHGDRAVSSTFFSTKFKRWVEELALGSAVAHQARHTLATNLLRAGASLAHIRRYLGQVSDRMAEHYTKVAHSDLEDVLHAVWVAGPGAPNSGELLSSQSTPLTRTEALALVVDLSRRSTPAEGGFCTFQPVVDGGACPWNLDCEPCDKFVLSGADLLYWRRKQEQWRSIAERAPDDATADYLHKVFEPTARAITGLEKALAGLGLLDEALKLDLRRPQDYFHRIWSTNFRAVDLAHPTDDDASTEQPA